MVQSHCWDQRRSMQCATISCWSLQRWHMWDCDRHVLVSADDTRLVLHSADSHFAGTLKSDAIVVHFTPKILKKNWLRCWRLSLSNNTVWLFGPDIPNHLHCNLIWSHCLLWLTCKRIRPLMDRCNNCDPGLQPHCWWQLSVSTSYDGEFKQGAAQIMETAAYHIISTRR